MTSTTVMNYSDPGMRTEVSVDASHVGVEAILAQHEDESTEPRIVAYSRRALTPVERRYSQIEREALAIVWVCERFHLYLYGSEFELRSDHKPFEQIFKVAITSSYRTLGTTPATVPNPADYISCHPTSMQFRTEVMRK